MVLASAHLERGGEMEMVNPLSFHKKPKSSGGQQRSP